jgi:hypothetical protein
MSPTARSASDNVPAIGRLREICLALPEVIERIRHGEVSFFVGKQFVSIDDHHHGADRLAFWCAAPLGIQEELGYDQLT